MNQTNTNTLVELKSLSDSQDLIAIVCDEIKEMLLEKNRKYGDSALHPTRIFAKSDSIEQIKVRIDDKLNRLKNAQGDEDEDVVMDLMGYLVLLRVAYRIHNVELDEVVDIEIHPDWPTADDWKKWSEPIQPWQPIYPYPSPYVTPWNPYAPYYTINEYHDGHILCSNYTPT